MNKSLTALGARRSAFGRLPSPSCPPLTAYCSLFTAFCFLSTPSPVFACAACFNGGADSNVGQAVNLFIFCLLGFVGGVLGGILAFIFYLRKRALSPQALAMHAMGHEEARGKPNRIRGLQFSHARETGFAPRSRSPSLPRLGASLRRFQFPRE